MCCYWYYYNFYYLSKDQVYRQMGLKRLRKSMFDYSIKIIIKYCIINIVYY